MHNFKNLKIWQKALDLTDLALYYIEELPMSERFNLIDQSIAVLALYRRILPKVQENVQQTISLNF